MAKVADVLEQLIKMGARFEALERQVLRIEDRQRELAERVVRLEEQRFTVVESARSAASAGVSELKLNSRSASRA